MFPIQDEIKPAIKPYVNYGLLLINIVVFFFLLVTGSLTEGLFMDVGAIPTYIVRGERLWTLLTSMFIHADIMHLFGNMIYLWVFGDNIEDAFGHAKYLVFYLLGGLAASFVHIASVFASLPLLTNVPWYLKPTEMPSVGASGAISAVLGAYILLYPKARIRTLVFYFLIQIITVPALYYLGFWFFYQLLMGFFSFTGLSSGVAFWAHIGGFVAGLVAVKAFGVKARPRRGAVVGREPVKPLYVSPKFRTPLVDVMVGGDRVRVVAELPGVKEEDIEVRVSGWELVITAKHGEIEYYKRVLLPFTVSPQVHDLDFRNGVLSFTLYRSMYGF